MKQLVIQPKQIVSYHNKEYRITRLIDLTSVLAENVETGELIKIEIQFLSQPTEKSEVQPKPSIDSIPEKDWEIAEYRFSIIRPIIDCGGGRVMITKIASENKIDRSTIYRWINRYLSTGTVSSLAPSEKSGGKGKSRLDNKVELIIKSVIEDSYLTPQKKSAQKIYEEIQRKCKNAGLDAPSNQTVRNRIFTIPNIIKVKKRLGLKAAKELYSPILGNFPGANYPLSTVQIDHTLIDIILVDEENRRPVGRPWITLAIDVFSRMVLGFHISFDPPGAMGTGACISHAILPKEKWLAGKDISSEWPCWGIMKTIHLDNAREFKGSMLKKACAEYGVELEWRPVATPHWGGHIERLLGTLLREIHTLPGTTFSNTANRKNYNSVNKAALTLSELERWLTIFVCDIYHKRVHKGINMTPIEKYREGIFGSNETPGTGLPRRILDDRKIRLDFMPFIERSIQEYGVLIGNIHYYHDVLRRWINSCNEDGGKAKRKFIFKIDPRDISIVYFFDPELKEYFPVPYRNTSRSPISKWEYNAILKKLKDNGSSKVNEEEIFEAYEKMRSIEEKALNNTRSKKRKSSKRLDRKSIHKDVINPKEEIGLSFKSISLSKNIKPFEDIDDGTPNE